MIRSRQGILTNALEQLAFRAKTEIDDSVSRGEIRPKKKSFQRWKVDNFRYTAQGVTEPKAHAITEVREVWPGIPDSTRNSIEKSDEYPKVLALLAEFICEEDKRVSLLGAFISRLTSRSLNNPEFYDAELDGFINSLIKEISGEPLKLGTKVELDGLVILADDIEFEIGDTKILLRRTKVGDLEKEIPAYAFAHSPIGEASAILGIEFSGRSARDIQIKVNQAVAILRLFRVGSVKFLCYRMRLESITDMFAGGTLYGGESEKALEKSVIEDKDEQQLVTFWETLRDSLPLNFYDSGEQHLDHRVISYKRYCDALFQNGVIERRIANAVMGLESLFLNEAQELSYRLKLRVSKLLGLVGHDPFSVRDVMNKAYGIRSQFVHGNHLSNTKREKKSFIF